MPKGYCTKNDIERYMLVDIDSSFNTQINDWIGVVENMIDNFTGRKFIADTTYSKKIYDGDGTDILLIDDFVALQKIEMGDPADVKDLIPATDYHTYPNNKLPQYKIIYDSIFSLDEQNIDVYAKWGYSVACPADIKLAATILASLIIENAWESQDETENESIGTYSITYNKSSNNDDKFNQAMNILKYYRKINF